MNLHVRRIRHVSALAVALDGSRTVAAHGVGRQKVGVSVTAGGNHNGIGREAFQLTGDEVLGDDAPCMTVYDDDILHLVAGIELHLPGLDLCAQGRVSTEQQLLAGLSLGVEGTAYLCAAE